MSASPPAPHNGGHYNLMAEDTCLRVTGSDAESYLQRMTTASFTGSAGAVAIPTLYLTPKGRVIAPMVAWRTSEPVGFELQVPSSAVASVHEGLERLVIMEDVTLEGVEPAPFFWTLQSDPQGSPELTESLAGSDRSVRSDGGERLRTTLESHFGVVLPAEPFASAEVTVGGASVRVLVRPRASAWGLDLSGRSDDLPAVLEALANVDGLEAWDPVRADGARVRGGWPRFGNEVTEKTIPQEAGLDAWISFTKGCFVGQEVVSRMHHLGHPNKRLCRLRSATEMTPGAKIFDPESDKEIGWVTSVQSPPGSFSTDSAAPEGVAPRSVALGYIGWRHATEDRTVRVGTAGSEFGADLDVLSYPSSCLT